MTGLESPLDWTDDGQPRSREFGDVYFSAQDGLAEARTVFLQGCGLPEAWADRRHFVIGELGFGTGLNIAALLDLWQKTRWSGGLLHIFSIEAFPVSAAEATRALGQWSELSEISRLLTVRWPGRARGRHRIDLPELNAVLDVAVMDVGDALKGWTGRADAWFLDGFSPALNPQMWTDDVLGLVAARSAPGARAATFTVAGQVRRGLTQAGFTVARQPGFGRKRERLEATWPGEPRDPARRSVAVIGAGIAGAAAARAVRDLGGKALVIDTTGSGAGASGNPAALVTPRLDAGLGEAAQLFAEAFRRAITLYATVPDAVLSRGALQVSGDERDVDRYGRIAASDIFEPGSLTLLDAEAASLRLGEPATVSLDQPDAMVVDPGPILAAWAGTVRRAVVASLKQAGEGWSLFDPNGVEILRADAVIVAAALGSSTLIDGLPLSPVRGQASWTTTGETGPTAAFGGYVLPTREGLLFGSTHDRDDAGEDFRETDQARNLEALRLSMPKLGGVVARVPLGGRASVRAVSQDMMPMAGATDQQGVYVLSGFGSRGFSLAPLLAEHVAALVMGAPSPISAEAAALVAPERFARRAARRGRS